MLFAVVKKGDAYFISPPRRVQWWGSLDEHPQPASSLTPSVGLKEAERQCRAHLAAFAAAVLAATRFPAARIYRFAAAARLRAQRYHLALGVVLVRLPANVVRVHVARRVEVLHVVVEQLP